MKMKYKGYPPKPTSWRYQLIRDKDGYLRTHEVYTDKDGGLSWTAEGEQPMGESLEDVLAELEEIKKDIIAGPILELSELEEKYGK